MTSFKTQANSYNFVCQLQGFVYVPRDELVSLVANEFRMQLSRALAVSSSGSFITYSVKHFLLQIMKYQLQCLQYHLLE